MPVISTETNVGRSRTVAYPLEKHRSTYINPQTSKPLTGFQWRVYDLVRKVRLMLSHGDIGVCMGIFTTVLRLTMSRSHQAK